MKHPFTILNVMGPYREPRESALSYDYSVQRAQWPLPQAVRVKVSIPEELDYCKHKVLEIQGGSAGQQLRMNQLLSRHIADRKLLIANEEGMFLERLDLMLASFTGPLSHLFVPLQAWMEETKDALRQEVREKTGVTMSSPT